MFSVLASHIRISLCFTVFLIFSATSAKSDGLTWVRAQLENAVTYYSGSQAQAIKNTLKRLNKIHVPINGKVVLVNVPAGQLYAFEGGIPILGSRVIVGQPAHETPELQNKVTFVRALPTWTVPESIVRRKGWRVKISKNPDYFIDRQFYVLSNGEKLSPYDAADLSIRPDTFIQKPGPHNALGLLKIGLNNHQAIYMHDTNQPELFNSTIWTASAGCIRVEKVRELSAWILNMDRDKLDHIIKSDLRKTMSPPSPVTVIVGYWTAWPKPNGEIDFFKDIYKKD
ncbi:L,D-transpeptidase family protein [Flexibacterium corallicola]|uniref:L,D-transpeptidase family protein n=1 Tax=Flexibacterium corallicola TaxID=3037259 RepID=UPI00286F0389|nr:L,D-transpeptidase family protein [Pseudovibrio sp. M1P-2-3]